MVQFHILLTLYALTKIRAQPVHNVEPSPTVNGAESLQDQIPYPPGYSPASCPFIPGAPWSFDPGNDNDLFERLPVFDNTNEPVSPEVADTSLGSLEIISPNPNPRPRPRPGPGSPFCKEVGRIDFAHRYGEQKTTKLRLPPLPKQYVISWRADKVVRSIIYWWRPVEQTHWEKSYGQANSKKGTVLLDPYHDPPTFGDTFIIIDIRLKENTPVPGSGTTTTTGQISLFEVWLGPGDSVDQTIGDSLS